MNNIKKSRMRKHLEVCRSIAICSEDLYDYAGTDFYGAYNIVIDDIVFELCYERGKSWLHIFCDKHGKLKLQDILEHESEKVRMFAIFNLDVLLSYDQCMIS